MNSTFSSVENTAEPTMDCLFRSRKTYLVAQLGARMHYAVPRILETAGLLESFFTDICAVKGWPRLFRNFPKRFQPQGLRRLLSRDPVGVPVEKIHALTSMGWAYQRARTRAKNEDQATKTHIAFGKKFCQAIVKKGFGGAAGTYTFNSAGLELMQAARKRGMITVMEQTIAPRAIELEILRKASFLYENWGSKSIGVTAVNEFVDREEEEWQHADLIICGSEFVRDGIVQRNGPADKCRVVPYGVDNHFYVHRRPSIAKPLKVLTVAEIGLRKGSPIVWAAAKLLGRQATFRMVGGFNAPRSVLREKPENVVLAGVVPRTQIFEHYAWADVFLLPSLCEGSATVTYEAMMSGCPVICTPNTGSIVENGVTGIIVPTFSVPAVVEALQMLVDTPEVLYRYCDEISKRITLISVEGYRNRLLKAIAPLRA